jgi:hypothetical protein
MTEFAEPPPGWRDITTAANAPAVAQVIQYVVGAAANNFIPPAGPMMSAVAQVRPDTPM